MRRYNANVRIGNWYNDLMLQEETIKQYMRRTKNSQLKVQKVQKLFLNILKEVPLSFPLVGLSFGAAIQIVSPQVPQETIFKIKEKQGIALAANILHKNVEKRSTFCINDPIIGTGLLTPCVRNVWTLVPDDKSRRGKKLCFGDSFHMQLCSSEPPLFLHAPLPTPEVEKGESGHIVPKLVAYTDSLTRFKVVHVDPHLRYESEGSPVPPFEKVVIIQGPTSTSLAVEPDTWFLTYFGMECEVSLHTFKDHTKPSKPDPRNFWSFILSSA